MDQRDYIVDIAGMTPPGPTDADRTKPDAGAVGRPWIAVHYKCCRTYARLYRNAAGDAYVGHCPKCGAKTRAAIGPGGTDQRFFTAE
ncbi:MAG: hypothetical protein AAGE65_06875 [Planctomycetota bacterium]